MTQSNARDRRPGVRTVAKSIRRSPLEVLWSLATSEPQDAKANDANEWYWVTRYGHPLVDQIEISNFISGQSIHAKALAKDEIEQLTVRDLDVLARSESPEARELAAGHRSCPPSALARLSVDPDPGVRKAVGHNWSTPAEVFAAMRRRPYGPAGDELDSHRLKFLWMELDGELLDPELALEVASDPGRYSAEYRLALGRRKYLTLAVREALAENSFTPPEVLALLVEDEASSVCMAAGINRSLPERDRLPLLHHRDPKVRAKVMIRGQFSDPVILAWDAQSESRRCLVTRLEEYIWEWADTRDSFSEAALRELAQSPHPETRAGVARNADTPVDVLDRLAEDDTAVVSAAAESALGWEDVKRHDAFGVDSAFIWWWRRDFAESEISQLARSSSPLLRRAIAHRVGRGSELDSLTRDPEPMVRRSAASNPLIDFDDLIRLSDDPDEQVRRAVADAVQAQLSVRMLPPESKENWLKHAQYIPRDVPRRPWGSREGEPDEMRLRIGRPWRREALWPPDEALERLSRVADEGIRAAVAGYSGSYGATVEKSSIAASLDLKLSAETLTRLLQDPSPLVREWGLKNTGPAAISVAADPSAPTELLVGYARSKAPAVRRAVAANSATPRPVLANLARDLDLSVRFAVAGNPGTPVEALSVLSEGQDAEVVLALLDNANTPPEFLEAQAGRGADAWEHERHRRLARNPGSPAAVLAKIAYSEWADVRRAVAQNKHTPSETLEILSYDEDPGVRQAANQTLDLGRS